MERILSDNLSKTYPGGKQALCHMNLSLGTGEVFGFLGPNGAGKTTTVKLLTGILTPTYTPTGCRFLPLQKGPAWSWDIILPKNLRKLIP